MGTTCSYKPRHLSGYEYLKRDGNFDYRAGETVYSEVAHAIVGSTIYVAIKRDAPGVESSVFGLVVKTSSHPGDRENFCWKFITEDMGPVEANCPKRIIDLLSPTTSEYANEWRTRCLDALRIKRERRASASLIQPGVLIEFNVPLSFGAYGQSTRFRCIDPKARTWWSEELGMTVKLRRSTISNTDLFSMPELVSEEPSEELPAPQPIAMLSQENMAFDF